MKNAWTYSKPVLARSGCEGLIALGVAFLAGLAVDFWKNIDEIQKIWQPETSFKPTKSRKKIKKEIKGWYKAIKALEYWTNI